VWRVAIVLVVAGCGRIGFDRHTPTEVLDGDASIPSDEIAIELKSEYGLGPVNGADVLVDRGGSLDRFKTDQDGVAFVPATTPTTIHVLFDRINEGSPGYWRIFTLVAVPPGTVVRLGDRPDPALFSASITVPTTSGNPDYQLRVARHCGNSAYATSHTFVLEYYAYCSTTPIHAVVTTRPAGTGASWYDAGTISLSEFPSPTIPTGTYVAMAMYTLQLTNVPAGLPSLTPELAQVSTDGADYFELDRPTSVANPTPTTTLQIAAMPGTNELRLIATGASANPASTTSQLAPIAPVGTTLAFDAGGLLPLLDTLVLDPSGSHAQWGPSITPPPGPAIVAFDAQVGQDAWTSYLPVGATDVTFPSLPSDLAAAIPTPPWYVAQAAVIAMPAATPRDLYTIDGDWQTWQTQRPSPLTDLVTTIVYSNPAP
jgi:hypothetical protein